MKMTPGKHNNNSKASSEDLESKKFCEESPVVIRSYDCTFCKRGFTNAQALGGHMNIHRKEKAKSKKKNLEVSINSTGFSSGVSSGDQQQQASIYNTGMGAQVRFQVYLPSYNPSFVTQIIHQTPVGRPQNLSLRDDHLDENLRLRIGPPLGQDGGKEKEVDLELRL